MRNPGDVSLDRRICCMAASGLYESPRAFPEDMNQTFISKPFTARPRVACLWLVHVTSGAMDGTVSGRAIG
jgi:hypothetical protein